MLLRVQGADVNLKVVTECQYVHTFAELVRYKCNKSVNGFVTECIHLLTTVTNFVTKQSEYDSMLRKT